MDEALRNQLVQWGFPHGVIASLESDGLTTLDLLAEVTEKDLRKAGMPKFQARGVMPLIEAAAKKARLLGLSKQTSFHELAEYLELPAKFVSRCTELGTTVQDMIDFAACVFARQLFTGDPDAFSAERQGFGANPKKFAKWHASLVAAGRISPETLAKNKEIEARVEAEKAAQRAVEETARQAERAARREVELEVLAWMRFEEEVKDYERKLAAGIRARYPESPFMQRWNSGWRPSY